MGDRGYFTRVFDEIERQFAELDDMIDSMFRTAPTQHSGNITVEGPYYYGFAMTVGPDGKPSFREFGNVRPTGRGLVEIGSREPSVDTVLDEKGGTFRLIAEMPGIEKKDIKVEATEASVSISAGNNDRKYSTEVPLNHEVDPDSAKVKYTNGVLEVIFRLKKPLKAKGVDVKVE